ncbi:MAG: transcriptional regulator, family [Firmicutes bacterium]|nr:transcriptional regulator, family [Bacillota bacterium]
MANNKKLSPIAEGILDGLKEAIAYSKGEKNNVRTTIVLVPNCKEIREKLNLSQNEFSKLYDIPLATLQGWEQGRRQPDTTASAYLRSISKYPEENRIAQEEQSAAIAL